jgi:tetratricopeptide (TPR) repeat protein
MRLASTVLALVLSVRPAAAGTAGVKWYEGPLVSALQEAQAQQRLVFVDVVAAWCAPCHQMDAELFPREEVGRALANGYIALRIDGESPEGAELANRYHVGTFPTLLVLDARGTEIERLMGVSSPTELVRALTHFREGKGGLAELERQLARAPTDALRFEVAMRYALRADPRAITEIAEVVKSDPQNREHRAASALTSLGVNYYGRALKDYARADSTLAEVERRFPTSPEAERVPYHRAVVLQKAGRAADARAILDAWIERAPKDVQRFASYAWFCFKDGGDRARGLVVARRGLELDPRNDALWDTLGELLLASGDVPEARKAFTRAAEIAPKKEYYQRQLKKLGGAP